MIELTAADDQRLSAYRADPPDKPVGGVVLLHEVYGLNPCIRARADAFAAAGYLALVPSLFDRVEPGLALGYDEAGLTRGLEVLRKVQAAKALVDVQAAVDLAGTAGKVALVGYGWGAYLAYQAANALTGLAGVVGYYGLRIVDEWRGKRAVPTLLHFGALDENVPAELLVQFRAGRPDVSVFLYQAGHGFDRDDGPGFDAAASQLARERTLTWISQYVVGQPPVLLKNAGAYAQAKADKKKKAARPAADDDGMGPPP